VLKKKKYVMKRQLTTEEIKQLEHQGCSAEDWGKILVHKDFDTNRIHYTSFEGNIEIGQGVSLSHVGLVKNISIHNDVSICRVNEITCDKWIIAELCKDGVTVGNEAGEPNIHFTLHPNEQLDWLNAHYPQHPHAEEIAIPEGSLMGEINAGCRIKNSGTLHNVHVEANVCIEGAAHLENGILLEGAYIGTQVIAHKFVIGPRTKVTDGAKLYHVITTHDCKIGKGFMAENCYFGHHSELFCGEGCAVFGGPHTVSHHKSTLLIGGEFSFYNAGSNTNQSNHAYKLGPVHHGTLARGSKTASGSHILWPMQTAPFCMVMGKVKTHPDLSALPFSYIIADGEKIFVAPGMNLGTAGTFRDVMKWKQRGSSPYTGEYDFLSPFVMQSVFKGIEVLEALQQEYGTEVEEYPYNGTFIRRSALLKGVERYRLAIRLYASKIAPDQAIHDGAREWHWIDVAGLPMVEELLTQGYGYLNPGLREAQPWGNINALYATQSQQWGAAMLAHRFGEKFTNGTLRNEAESALEDWKKLLIADARKELALGDMDEALVDDFIQKVEKNGKDSL
jgi:hypothetical protein